MGMRNIIIVDLDHTISDARWRDHMLMGPGRTDWTAYHRAAVNDLPVEAVIKAVDALHAAGMRTVALTGRTQDHEASTIAWLVQHLVPIDLLLMRPADDHRQATIVKEELLKYALGEDWPAQVLLAFEDNEHVAELFAIKGITVLRPVLPHHIQQDQPNDEEDQKEARTGSSQ
jgi:hypothetical protein